MKFSKQLRFAALSVVCMSALASCIKDPVGGGLPDADLASTKLAISLPGIQNGMKTRAGVPSDYDIINNLNIFITSGDEILHSLYIDNDAFGSQGSYDDLGITDAITHGPDGENYVVTYTGEWLDAKDGVHRRGANNYIVVANYRNPITVTSVTNLRKIEVGVAEGHVDPSENVMFGESGMEVTMNPDGLSGNKSVKLERIAAMITLVIDGSGLNSGVTITPVDVSLHNVPTKSYIGQRNIVTTTPNESNPVFGTTPRPGAVSPNGETWHVRTVWEPITSANGVRGKHYDLVDDTEIDGKTIKVPDFSTENVSTALFMYENYHGENFGATGVTGAVGSQHQKRPAAAIDESETAINAVAGACSYLQVTARYNNNNNNSGEITYRVFLGANEFDDFNILRNHYYLVTLNLTGTGIGEGDASWRLATNLSTSINISESDFILNAAGEVISITANGNITGTNFKVSYVGNNQSQANANRGAWIFIEDGAGGWKSLDGLNGTGNGGKLSAWPGTAYFYVQPMIRNVTWFGASDVHKREVTFNIAGNNGHVETPNITITQWEPIPIPLSQYADYAEIKALVDELGWDMAGTLYLDRVDYPEPLPWGFYGVDIAGGDITDLGFTNGDNLMRNYPAASAYSPYGYANGGSAVMRAAFMKYYQRATTPLPTNLAYTPSFANVRDYAGANTPDDYPWQFFIPSEKEWTLLNMLHKKKPINYEEEHAILSFVPYWTSTAVAGSDDANVFNMDGFIPGGASPQSRTTPTRYRMMYYRP